ncbi:hypothetical protein BMETH_3066_0 [methanotrophic bacterial endosymbiont of Bathymodiolus sp.]|nr:hypothetical protein BMETH_3066_0 [methanotrophic bacterial endosymbiont of Bathymodiolus sp.]
MQYINFIQLIQPDFLLGCAGHYAVAFMQVRADAAHVYNVSDP